MKHRVACMDVWAPAVRDVVTAPMLEQVPRVRMIQKWGIGIDSIDAARRRVASLRALSLY